MAYESWRSNIMISTNQSTVSGYIWTNDWSHLLHSRWATDVLGSLFRGVQFLSPPGFPQGSEGGLTRGGGGGGGGGGGVGGVWPLEVEESVLEAVGGDLLWLQLSPSLHHRPLPQVSQEVSETGALQEMIQHFSRALENCQDSHPDYD